MYNINTDLNTNYVQIKLNITLGRFQKQLDYVRNSRTTIRLNYLNLNFLYEAYNFMLVQELWLFYIYI